MTETVAKSKQPSLLLKVLSPSELVLERHVEFVVVPALDGDIGVRARHTPFVASTRAGTLKIRTELQQEELEELPLGPGFVEILEQQVTVLLHEDVAYAK